MSEYNGYDLFEDIECPKLRLSNRVAVCANMLLDNQTKEGIVKPQGIMDFLNYLRMVPSEDRKELVDTVADGFGIQLEEAANG